MEVFHYLMPVFTEYGYFAVFAMLLVCGLGVPVPEDVTLVTGGVIAGLGYANPHVMFAVGMAGVIVGDGMVFTAGRLWGQRIARWRIFSPILTPARFCKAQDAFHKYGRWVMFVARFLPGLRTPVFFSAGMSHRVNFATWLFMDASAALISVPIWVYVGYYGARNWDWMFGVVRQFQCGLLGFSSLGLLWLLWRWYLHRRRAVPTAGGHPP